MFIPEVIGEFFGEVAECLVEVVFVERLVVDGEVFGDGTTVFSKVADDDSLCADVFNLFFVETECFFGDWTQQ